MSSHLEEVHDFFEAFEGALAPWLTRQFREIQFGIELANQDVFTDTLDIVAGGTFWKVCVEQKMDAISVLELAVRASLARREGISIQRIGWIQPLEGTVISLTLDNEWDTCVDQILA